MLLCLFFCMLESEVSRAVNSFWRLHEQQNKRHVSPRLVSQGKGHVQRQSSYTSSPPVSPQLPLGPDAAMEESRVEAGAESPTDEHQQAVMQHEERVLTEQIENLQKEK